MNHFILEESYFAYRLIRGDGRQENNDFTE